MVKLLPVRIFNGMEVYQTSAKGRAPREYIYVDDRKIYLHIFLAETFIRPLKSDEVVHHKDGNPLNNELSNLEIMTRADHVRLHKPATGYIFSQKQRYKMSAAHIGQVAWNKGKKGFKHSDQSKQNMSKAQKGREITWGDKIAIAKTKVTKEQLILYLTENPLATMASICAEFSLKSRTPIYKHGGLTRLKREAI